MPELSDRELEELKTPTADIELEAKPSNRQVEFAKITEIIKTIQEDFLKDEDMTIADAIKRLQDALTKLAPKDEFKGLMDIRGPGLAGPPGSPFASLGGE